LTLLHAFKDLGFEALKIRFKTIHFNMFEISCNEICLNFIEKHKIGSIVDAVICVLDTKDKIEDARQIIKVINHTRFSNIPQHTPFLIVSNKQDCNNSMSTTDILSKLPLYQQDAFRYTNWCVQLACARSGDGVTEAMNWIFESLQNKS